MPFVSIIIATRNEEKYIAKCIESLLKQDYPKLEIIFVDGKSEDRTKEIIGEYAKKYSFIRLFDNPKKFAPFAFNIGIKNSSGEFVMIMGAHTLYKENYISTCIRYMEERKVDIVGGIELTMPGKNSLIAKSIALNVSSPFGSGDAHYRTGNVKEPVIADVVDYPCYRKEVFNKVGLFNEGLTRSQDIEFNLRLKRAGGKILLVPDAVSYYYPKSNLKDFFIHNFEDGIWAVYPLKFKEPLHLRHYTPLIFVFSLLSTFILGLFFPYFLFLFSFILISYLLVSLYFSIKIAIREKNPLFIVLMPISFMARHFGYGIGSIWGALTIWKVKTINN